MKILLFGKNGQLGWELQRSLALLGEVVALSREDPGGDLAQPEALRQAVRAVAPDVIVNAAAYTAVDLAEREPQQAEAINALAPQVLAEEALSLDAWLVHYSTDYVFDGSGNRPWREDDATAPLSVYGSSKLEGERRIRASGAKHLILRTSWVYGAHGQNFLKTMLRLGTERERLTVVDDQIGAPTGAELLADATAHALRQATLGSAAFSGLYHLTASGEASWFDYARHALASAHAIDPALRIANVEPIPTSAYPTPARRPLNSRLDTSHFQQIFGLHLPDWRQGVDRTVTELLARR
ncbi:dTDP-4-dehydrorhamnose reductase [Corticibacter populi]|uniref:dTDP-4-dehydrorhamnose reductase n=1 Tax=Corticibacter populi TaxID=1550736 RepID=A0A3M6QR47_9BURK|nr:dTDP-4-dehydrorhamnose reductase [Corticibacter populi]RMX05029.1 dTDP-4-dehydrorhamnose reductase [Corticibacter populi]RZS33535.1 dTDP-4-dehydrorhamnose reductase [Corticibacter populi]